MSSILNTVKAGLGIGEDDPSFDVELKIHINSTFQTLRQLGVGPATGFLVLTDAESWEDYLGVQKDLLTSVQTYIILKVKLVFDPPDVGFVITSMERLIEQMEWRMLVDTDKPPVTTEEVTTP